jgi:predicted nucleotidyltransferase
MVEYRGVVDIRDTCLRNERISVAFTPTSPHFSSLIGQVVRIAHPLRIVLFGSAARGQAGPESDLDLLVVMPDGTHRRHTSQRLYRGIKNVGVPFDLLVATPSDLEKHRQNIGLIYSAILREGVEVYAVD